MDVKIGDVVFTSAACPVMVVLSEDDKRNIANMAPDATRYAACPDGYFPGGTAEFSAWMARYETAPLFRRFLLKAENLHPDQPGYGERIDSLRHQLGAVDDTATQRQLLQLAAEINAAYGESIIAGWDPQNYADRFRAIGGELCYIADRLSTKLTEPAT